MPTLGPLAFCLGKPSMTHNLLHRPLPHNSIGKNSTTQFNWEKLFHTIQMGKNVHMRMHVGSTVSPNRGFWNDKMYIVQCRLFCKIVTFPFRFSVQFDILPFPHPQLSLPSNNNVSVLYPPIQEEMRIRRNIARGPSGLGQYFSVLSPPLGLGGTIRIHY